MYSYRSTAVPLVPSNLSCPTLARKLQLLFLYRSQQVEHATGSTEKLTTTIHESFGNIEGHSSHVTLVRADILETLASVLGSDNDRLLERSWNHWLQNCCHS